MRIDKLTVRNFQGVESAEIEPGAIAFAFGLNGAGKTSLVDALLWVLTGDPGRAGTLPEIIRQGAKAAEVEVVIDGATITRRRTKSAGEVFVNGVQVKAAEADAAIAAAAGAPVAVLAAALRSGRILELPPADLLALLSRLTGAGVEESAIREALGPAVVEAAGRLGLPLPHDLDAFAVCCKAAEGMRQSSKRTLAEREADLARLTVDARALSVVATAGGVEPARAGLRAALSGLRARREKALVARAAAQAHDAGAREARLTSLRDRLAELMATPEPPDGDPAREIAEFEEAIRAADRELSRIDGARGVAEARAAALRRTLPATVSVALPGDDAGLLRAELATARKLLADHDAALARAKDDGARLRKAHDEANAHDCGGGCKVHCPDMAGLKAQLDEAIRTYKEADKKREPMAKRAADLEARLALAEEAAGRAELARLQAEIASLDAERASVAKLQAGYRTELDARRGAADAHAAYRRAVAEAGRVEAEIERIEREPAPAPVADAEDPEALAREIAAVDSDLRALDQVERHAAAAAGRDRAAAAIEDADLVAKACGPKGARASLIASACGPFLDAANEALARLHPDLRVALETDGELAFVVERGAARLRPVQLSEGEKTRLRWVLQYAAAKLAGVGILVLDHAELLDETGAAGAKHLAAECAREGMQVLMLSCKPPPATVPAGVSAYVMEAGRSRPIPAAQAA